MLKCCKCYPIRILCPNTMYLKCNLLGLGGHEYVGNVITDESSNTKSCHQSEMFLCTRQKVKVPTFEVVTLKSLT